MKFNCSVDINRPIDRVVELFKNPDNLKEWQEGFISAEKISGLPGEAGSKSRFLYKMGKNEMELLETIIKNDLPHAFEADYWHKHMSNTMRWTFEPLDENTTRYAAEVEYTELRGMMIKVMAFLMPGMFRKQVQKWMDRFKAFAESTE